MVIDTINQDYVDWSVFKSARGGQPPKASANDHHYASLVGHAFLTQRRELVIDGWCENSRVGVQMIGVQVSSNSEDGRSTLEADGGCRHHRDITDAHIRSPGLGWDTNNASS